MFSSPVLTITATRINCLYLTPQIHKNQVGKEGERKMEMTMQERLIQFINDLTDEECEMIVSYLTQEDANAKQGEQ